MVAKHVDVCISNIADAGSIPAGSTNFIMDAETWHIPLKDDRLTVNEALSTMESFKLNQDDVPFIIKFFENPKYNILPGAVTLQVHDIIHVLLGRGLLPKDEAFVIGFTMGTTKQLTKTHKKIFKLVTQYLYPEGYRFGHDEHSVFETGVNCAEQMICLNFAKLDLTAFVDYTIREAREELDINVDLLLDAYTKEKASYDSPESQRLLCTSNC